jgi:hypothetical protein
VKKLLTNQRNKQNTIISLSAFCKKVKKEMLQ